MGTMNVSLPDALEAFVDEQIEKRGNDTSSECGRELIRRDHDRLQPRNLLLAGTATAPGVPGNAAHLEKLRRGVPDAIKSRVRR